MDEKQENYNDFLMKNIKKNLKPKKRKHTYSLNKTNKIWFFT